MFDRIYSIRTQHKDDKRQKKRMLIFQKQKCIHFVFQKKEEKITRKNSRRQKCENLKN